jgi:hypothetical protein
MKKLKSFILVLITALSYGYSGSNWGFSNLMLGNLKSLLEPGAASIRTMAADQALSGSGKVIGDVNIFNGQPHYYVPLGGLSVRGVAFPIGLTYTGDSKKFFKFENEREPSSWVGAGFNLSIPFVATNPKGTYSSFDDIIFCNLGPYGGGQLLKDETNSRFYVSTNPYIKVTFDTATTGEYAGQFTKWTFTFPDGKKMVFGQDTNAQRYVLYNKGVVKASPFSYVSPQKFIYRWDVRSFYDSVPNQSPKNIINFEYERILEQASPNKYYVREGYIKEIKWMVGTQEVERYEFETTNKRILEWTGSIISNEGDYWTTDARDDQKIYETRKLQYLRCYREGVLAYYYQFDIPPINFNSRLDRIRVFYPKPMSNSFLEDSGWVFTYDASKYYLLNTVTAPSSLKETYNYAAYNFSGKAGGPDTNGYTMRRADSTSDIPLPSDTAKLSKWKVESQCDERFCYSIVRDGDDDTIGGGPGIRQKVYVEVKRNLGNYFDLRATDKGDLATLRLEFGDSTSTADQWKIIPAGNYLLAASENTGKMWLYEYDGVKWTLKNPFLGDPHWVIGKGFDGPIRLAVSSNYFVIQKYAQPSSIIVALRKDSGWTTLNRNLSNCDFNNKDNYGETIRALPGTDCLEWSRNDLIITPNLNFFTVLDQYMDVFCAYALKKDGSGFTEISKKFQPVTSLPGYPMNWQEDVASVDPFGDYLFIQNYNQSSGYHIHGFYFDGDTLAQVIEPTSWGAGFQEVFPSDNFFVVVHHDSPSGKVDLFTRTYDYTIGSLQFNRSTVRSDYNPNWKVLVRTHPDAFTIEYYPDSASVGLRPKWEPSPSTNYCSYLYQVSKWNFPGFSDRTPSLLVNGRSLFNTSFSNSDNLLVGSSGDGPSNGRCNENPNVNPCTINYYTARIRTNDTTSFIDSKNLISANNNWTSLKQSQKVMSAAARIGTQIILDNTSATPKVRYKHYQFEGKGFSVPDSVFVVSSVLSEAGLGSSDNRHVNRQLFSYSPVSGEASEYNAHLQAPQFESAEVYQTPTSMAPLGSSKTSFYLDKQDNPLSGKSAFLNGVGKYSSTRSDIPDTTTLQIVMNDPYRNSAWPQALYVNRPQLSYSTSVARNRGRISDTTYFLNYCDTNGAPRFTLSNNRPEKIILKQRIFDSLGFIKQSVTYKLSSQPSTDSLKTWGGGTLYRNTSAIASSKSVFQGYLFSEDSVWREQDQNLTDADLRSGTTPSFMLNEGWLPSTKITQRDTNTFFQVVESKVVKSKVAGAASENYTSYFYEGLRSDPVASIINSKLDNCAILMSENGSVSLTGGILDYRGKWSNPGATFSTLHSHTGRYSIKVVDNYGPSINLYLKDVRELGFGFKVSAWVYADTGTPVLMVERHSGGVTTFFPGSPVSGSTSDKKVWQRWEANLSYNTLTNGGAFLSGNNDYLRVWVGTGGATGNIARVIYADDIICWPTNAVFSLVTHDKQGLVTSTTDANHLPTFYDINFKGQVSAVRDEKYRIFGQAAIHRMGEN